MNFDDRLEDRKIEDRNIICFVIFMYGGGGGGVENVLVDLKVWFDVFWGDFKKYLICFNVVEIVSFEVNVI